jgi:acetylglutamate kinase
VLAKDRVVLAEPHAKAAQLGFVGTVKTIQTSLLSRMFSRQVIPVISPIGVGDPLTHPAESGTRSGPGGQLYNINADDVACEVAAHLKAEKLVLLTNVRGILREPADAASLISTLSMKEAKMLVERQVIQGGMIPKVKSCIGALKSGVKKAHIIDAAIPRAMLLEMFTKQGVGTELVH